MTAVQPDTTTASEFSAAAAPLPQPHLLTRGVEVPPNLPSFLQDFFARCLLRRSDFAADPSLGPAVPPHTADLIRRGQGSRVHLPELRQILSDLFHSSSENFSLMFDVDGGNGGGGGGGFGTEDAAAAEEREHRQSLELRAALGFVAGGGVDVSAVGNARSSSLSGGGAAEGVGRLGLRERAVTLLEYGTEPCYHTKPTNLGHVDGGAIGGGVVGDHTLVAHAA